MVVTTVIFLEPAQNQKYAVRNVEKRWNLPSILSYLKKLTKSNVKFSKSLWSILKYMYYR